MRGLSEKTLQFIKNSDDNVAVIIRSVINEINGENKNKLFLGIRENYIIVYSMGAMIVKIEFNTKGAYSKCHTHKKYLYGEGDGYESITLSNIDSFNELVVKVKNYVENKKASKTFEKQYQQRIMLSNNEMVGSNYFCYDMEYSMGTNGYGRYDILAISMVPNNFGEYSIGLIEVKVDSGSFGTGADNIKKLLDNGKIVKIDKGEYEVKSKLRLDYDKHKGSLGSGILGHFSDYVRYINDDDYIKKHGISRFSVTKNEAVNVLKNYIELGLYHEKLKNFASLTVNMISDVPQFVFLNYANKKEIKSIKDSFSNYVLGTSTLAITKVWDENVIDQYRGSDSEIQFKCIFKEGFPEDEANRAIFSDVEISEAKNIFDEEAYK
ncbi:MAG: hypothetical protein IJV92_04565 [Phascolarctobacterium sp.]|nr:hypothetical protein [Phascolarctobacterium sp.]